MSPTLILAPAARGKTAHVVDLARRRAQDPGVEVRVCVPTGLQARAWRHRLAAAGGALGVHVFTFDGLAAACLDAAGVPYTVLSEPVGYRLLRTVVNGYPLVHYRPLVDKPGFATVLQGVTAVVKAAGITPAQFQARLGALGAAARLTELAGLYAAYQQQLQTRGWVDWIGCHWLAAETMRARPEVARDWPLLIVDGFDDFTRVQRNLLRQLARRVEQLVITLTDTPDVAGRPLYPRYRRTRHGLAASLAPTIVNLPSSTPAVPALSQLAAGLFQAEAAPVAAGGAVRLLEASDREAEVRAALRWLKGRLLHEGEQPDQLALLARNIGPYRPFIRQVAAEFDLPVWLEGGRPLAQSPVIAALMDLLRLHLPLAGGVEPALPRRGVVAAWRSPYFSWRREGVAIDPGDADGLDRVARQQRVIAGLSQWQAALVAQQAVDADLSAGDEESPGAVVPTGAAAAALQAQFTFFYQATRPPAAATMRAHVAWLEALIGPDPAAAAGVAAETGLDVIGRARAGADRDGVLADLAALHALQDVLRGLVWAETALGEDGPIRFAAFWRELAGAVETAVFRPPPAVEAAILAADVARARGLTWRAVALLGLAEGAFPQSIAEDPLLRDPDRARLRTAGAAPDGPLDPPPSTLSAEREFFYEAVTRASHALLLTRPCQTEDGAEWVASPFWEAVRRLVGDTAVEVPPQEPAVGAAASWAEAREAVAATLAGGAAPAPDWVVAADPETWAAVVRGAAVARGRAGPEPTVHDGHLERLGSLLADRFGPDTVWSASSLERYRTCGFMFFVQNVLQLAPRPEPVEGLDNTQLGGLYHALLERVTSAGVPAPGADVAETERAVEQIGREVLDRAPVHYGFRETPWWWRTKQEILAHVSQTVMALAAGEFRFLQAEARFGDRPLILRDADDRLQLGGFIDRVDRAPDGRVRIIDYKLGGRSVYTSRAFAAGDKLQLPLYALAAEQALELGSVADGYYWFYRQGEASSFTLAGADGGVAGAVAAAVDHAWTAVRHIRAGHFTPRPPDGGCPPYCPAAAFCWRYQPRAY